MTVNLISMTPDAEKTIGYCARVSNPKNQDNPEVSGLSSVSSMDTGLFLKWLTWLLRSTQPEE